MLTPKSVGLSGLCAVIALVTIIDRPAAVGVDTRTVVIASVQPDDVTRIELSRATEKTVLERSDQTGRWSITSPIEQDADQARIDHLLSVFRREITTDIQVDSGNLKDYQLDASGGIVVELWARDAQPTASFTIGVDLPGGASMVRISGNEAVYRARVGGRRRYDRRPTDWRNRVVLDFEEANIQGLTIQPSQGEMIQMVRAPTEEQTGDGPWTLDPDPGWSLDATALQAIVTALGRMRAASILADDFDGGFSPPIAEITIVDKDGIEHVMAIGTREAEGAAFVRVNGAAGVFAVPRAAVAPLLRSAEELKDLSIYRIDPGEITKFIFYQRRTRIELGQHPQTGVWGVVHPAGLTVDVADVQYAVRVLAHPRADEEGGDLANARTGLRKPLMVFEVQKRDGSHEALLVGRPFRGKDGQTYFFVKRQNDTMVYIMREEALSKLRKSFGQG